MVKKTRAHFEAGESDVEQVVTGSKKRKERLCKAQASGDTGRT